MILINVDLPAPLSPTRPSTCPASSLKLTSWSAWTPPKDFETCLSSRTVLLADCSLSVDSDMPIASLEWRPMAGEHIAHRPPRHSYCEGRKLPDLLVDERRDHGDVRLVDEAATRVDAQAAEAVFMGQAKLLDAHVALEPLLLVDHQVDVAILDALHRSGRHVEARHVHRTRRQVGRLHEGGDG